MDKHQILKEYYGHDEFRGGQETVIDALLGGRDALCIMPTGAGKSVCYQIPALIMEGVTLVISPLISLMKDQVTALVQAGIPAAYINSTLTPAQYDKVLYRMSAGAYKIVYVAPERLEAPTFLDLCRHMSIPFVAVDEAHCVSQWGQDFRPSYLKIAEFIRTLPTRPVVGAFTATATEEVKRDICYLLHLQDPVFMVTGFDRPNLFFSVLIPEQKMPTLLDLVEERREASGIIYCATRKQVEEVCEVLVSEGYPATRYHAGLSDEERRRNQEDFVYDRFPIMVATNAFGMGIDKSNVSYVIHYNMPKNMESYYQEAGRAGRDGERAECILLYAAKDIVTNRFLVAKTAEENPDITEDERYLLRRRELERLQSMIHYAVGTGCLRANMLRYFGEQAPDTCGNCSNCLGDFESVDITIESQKIMSCIKRTGERYGVTLITQILRGKKDARITALRLDQQSTYGIMRGYPSKDIRQMIQSLEAQGYIAGAESEYPYLMLTEISGEVLFEHKSVIMKRIRKPAHPKRISKREARRFERARGGAASGTGGADMLPMGGRSPASSQAQTLAEPAEEQMYSEKLMRALKSLRADLANEAGVPLYVIFSNATLADMCRRLPRTPEEFLEVSGVGRAKQQKYAERFLKVIAQYAEEA